jgi:tetratricopeptide (TPR) repeat protein
MDRRRVRRHPVLLATLVTSLQAGCRPVTTDDSGTSAPLTSASAAPAALCVGGQSEDPPMRDLDRALVAFEAKRYREAQALLDGLAQRFPRSATVRVWRGEATLYEGKLEDGADAYRDAATHALKFYREAAALHEAGCRLLASDHYYLRMGAAYAQLRLGAPNLALRELDIARATWPNSAEVPYTMARAECLRGRVDDCLAGFRATLEIARERRRPMFLRTHRSVADWVVRSRTQSEFGPLRADPRYQQLVREPWAAED